MLVVDNTPHVFVFTIHRAYAALFARDGEWSTNAEAVAAIEEKIRTWMAAGFMFGLATQCGSSKLSVVVATNVSRLRDESLLVMPGAIN